MKQNMPFAGARASMPDSVREFMHLSRFFANIEMTNACWNWRGGITGKENNRYGRIQWGVKEREALAAKCEKYRALILGLGGSLGD